MGGAVLGTPNVSDKEGLEEGKMSYLVILQLLGELLRRITACSCGRVPGCLCLDLIEKVSKFFRHLQMAILHDCTLFGARYCSGSYVLRIILGQDNFQVLQR